MSGGKLDGKKDAGSKKKLEQERLQIILNELLREEENKYCADCEAKGPRWASWNLGVFLCIRCAGIHRNLGVHVSKVKSVNLDTWTPEQVQSIRVFGNSVARAVYEAHLPEHFRRPQTDGTLETFIRAKYEIKRYAMKDWQPPKVDVRQLMKELENFHNRPLGIAKKIAPSPSLIDHKTNQCSSVPPHVEEINVDDKRSSCGKGSNDKRHARAASNAEDALKSQNKDVSATVDLLGLDFGSAASNQKKSNIELAADLFNVMNEVSADSNFSDPSAVEFGEFAIAAPAPSFVSTSLETSTAPDSLSHNRVDKSAADDADNRALFDLDIKPAGEKKTNADILALYGGKNQCSSAVTPSFLNAPQGQTSTASCLESQGFFSAQNFGTLTNQQAPSAFQPIGGVHFYRGHQAMSADFAAFNPFNQPNAGPNLFQPSHQPFVLSHAGSSNVAIKPNFVPATVPRASSTYEQSVDLKAVQEQLAAIKLQKHQPQQQQRETTAKAVTNSTTNVDFWQ